MTTPPRPTLALTAAAALLAAAAPAAAQQVGDRLGTTAGEIVAALEAMGDEVLEFDVERDRIEVEVRRDAGRFEIYVDRRDGLVTKVERED